MFLLNQPPAHQYGLICGTAPGHGDESRLGQGLEKELHGKQQLPDLLVTADMMGKLREVTGEPSLVNLWEDLTASQRHHSQGKGVWRQTTQEPPNSQ